MCIKIDNQIECEKCGYSYSEAKYPDDYDNPLDCNSDNEKIASHIINIECLKAHQHQHPWDCKCLLHR